MGDYQHPISCDSEVVNLSGDQNTLKKYTAHAQNISCGVGKGPDHMAILWVFFYPLPQCNQEISYTFVEFVSLYTICVGGGRTWQVSTHPQSMKEGERAPRSVPRILCPQRAALRSTCKPFHQPLNGFMLLGLFD